MALAHEDIHLSPDETFRLLRWTGGVNRVEAIRNRKISRIHGHGDHWHYHRAMELTYFERGKGTRFVADHIEMFRSGDMVLIGPNVPHYWHSHGRSAGLSVQWDFPLDHGIWSFGETAAPLQALAQSSLRGLHLRGATAAAAADLMAGLWPPSSSFSRCSPPPRPPMSVRSLRVPFPSTAPPSSRKPSAAR